MLKKKDVCKRRAAWPRVTLQLLGILCSRVSQRGERYEHPKMVVSSRMKKRVESGRRVVGGERVCGRGTDCILELKTQI